MKNLNTWHPIQISGYSARWKPAARNILVDIRLILAWGRMDLKDFVMSPYFIQIGRAILRRVSMMVSSPI